MHSGQRVTHREVAEGEQAFGQRWGLRSRAQISELNVQLRKATGCGWGKKKGLKFLGPPNPDVWEDGQVPLAGLRSGQPRGQVS